MNLEVTKIMAEKPRREMVMKFLENQVRGPHLISTLELFILFPICGSLDKLKQDPFILSSWTHLVSALFSVFSFCNCPLAFQYIHNFSCTTITNTPDVAPITTAGTHHFLHTMGSEEVYKRVRERAWKRKKKQHSWKICCFNDSIFVSRRPILRPKRCSSLCQSFKSNKWPELSEICRNGWCWITEIMRFWVWFSCSTGISTMWAAVESLVSAIGDLNFDDFEFGIGILLSFEDT